MTRKRIERYLLDNYPALRYQDKQFDRVLADVRKSRHVAQAAEREKQQLASAARHIANGLRPELTARPDDTADALRSGDGSGFATAASSCTGRGGIHALLSGW